MTGLLRAALAYLQGLASAEDPTKSPRIVAFLVGTVLGGAWVSFWVYRGPRDGNLVGALVAFFSLVGLAKVFGNDDRPRPA